MVGSIMIVGTLTRALLHTVGWGDLKAARMNVQHSLMQEHMLYKLKLNHNTTETTKNNYCAKDEDAFDHSTITRWFKIFCLGCWNFNDQPRADRPKSMDSKAMLHAIEANLVSNTRKV